MRGVFSLFGRSDEAREELHHAWLDPQIEPLAVPYGGFSALVFHAPIWTEDSPIALSGLARRRNTHSVAESLPPSWTPSSACCRLTCLKDTGEKCASGPSMLIGKLGDFMTRSGYASPSQRSLRIKVIDRLSSPIFRRSCQMDRTPIQGP